MSAGRFKAIGKTYPERFSDCIAFIVPKMKSMKFSVDLQTNLLSHFLKGMTEIFIEEYKEKHQDE